MENKKSEQTQKRKQPLQILFVILLALLALSVTVQAQTKSLGVSLGHSVAGNQNGVRIGADFTWNMTPQLRLAPSFTAYLPSYNKLYTLTADLHYLIPVTERITFYPLVGFGGFFAEGFNKMGLNAGAGADYRLSSNWIMNVKAKYQWIKHESQCDLSAGIAYQF